MGSKGTEGGGENFHCLSILGYVSIVNYLFKQEYKANETTKILVVDFYLV